MQLQYSTNDSSPSRLVYEFDYYELIRQTVRTTYYKKQEQKVGSLEQICKSFDEI